MGGFIDDAGTARYRIKPDKETSLRDPYSKVIYYRTSELKNEKQSFLIAYNGFILEEVTIPVQIIRGRDM